MSLFMPARAHRRPDRRAIVLWSVVVALGLIVGCGKPTQSAASSNPSAAAASPAPDAATQHYFDLVHRFWQKYSASEGGPGGLRVCVGGAQAFQLCGERAAALLVVLKNFLTELDTAPAPFRYAVDDRAFRSELPQAISDLTAMVGAANAKNKAALLDSSYAFAADINPAITTAWHDVDPSAPTGI